MDKINPQQIGSLIKQSRINKGYTQQQVATMAKLSLRSIQRIEKGEVMPRQYSLDMLATQLEFTPLAFEKASKIQPMPVAIACPANNSQKLILSVGTGIILILLTAAYIAQAGKFPETNFEAFLLGTFVISVYLVALWYIWK